VILCPFLLARGHDPKTCPHCPKTLTWDFNQIIPMWYAQTPTGTYLVTLEGKDIWTVVGRDGERLGWKPTADEAKAVAEEDAS